MLRTPLTVIALTVALSSAAPSQRSMSITDYSPKSTLVVPQHPVNRAKYPFIDVHNHQDSMMAADKLDQLVKDMDSINLQVMVNLSGGYGDKLEAGVGNMKRNYKNRFVVFATSISRISTRRITAAGPRLSSSGTCTTARKV
jgi:hypothetical protein